MKLRIYILCYDEESRKIAQDEYGTEEWAKIHFIETTPYMENIMFNNWFIENKEDWKEFDYVGTLSWKTTQKIGKIDMNYVINRLQNEDPDIYVFFPFDYNMISHATHFHPKFSLLWFKLLYKMNIDYETSMNPNVKAFFCNYWICKPSWLESYIDFFNQCKYLLDEEEDIQEDLWSDSTYKGKLPTDKLLKIYNKSYYPYHCFICERLPCFFFWWKNAKLIY